MLNNGSSFYRAIIHTVGVLFLIGMLGSTALGGEDLLSSVVQAIYSVTFGSSGTVSTDGTSSSTSTTTSGSGEQPTNGGPNQVPTPPDSTH